MIDIQNLYNGLSLPDLLKCREILNKTTDCALDADKKDILTKNINNYTSYTDQFLLPHSDLYKAVEKEINSLNFKKMDASNDTNSMSVIMAI